MRSLWSARKRISAFVPSGPASAKTPPPSRTGDVEEGAPPSSTPGVSEAVCVPPRWRNVSLAASLHPAPLAATIAVERTKAPIAIGESREWFDVGARQSILSGLGGCVCTREASDQSLELIHE